MKTLEEINTNYVVDTIDFFANEYISTYSYHNQYFDQISFRLERQLEVLKTKGFISEYLLLIEKPEKSVMRDCIISTILSEQKHEILGTLSVKFKIYRSSNIIQRKYNIFTDALLK